MEVIQPNCYNLRQLSYNIKNYKTVPGNIWICNLLIGFLTSTQSHITCNSLNQTFPFQCLNIAKHKNHIPKGLKIKQQVKKIRTQEKVCQF